MKKAEVKTESKLIPIGDYVLIEMVKRDKPTKSGIITPESAKGDKDNPLMLTTLTILKLGDGVDKNKLSVGDNIALSEHFSIEHVDPTCKVREKGVTKDTVLINSNYIIGKYEK